MLGIRVWRSFGFVPRSLTCRGVWGRACSSADCHIREISGAREALQSERADGSHAIRPQPVLADAPPQGIAWLKLLGIYLL